MELAHQPLNSIVGTAFATWLRDSMRAHYRHLMWSFPHTAAQLTRDDVPRLDQQADMRCSHALDGMLADYALPATGDG